MTRTDPIGDVRAVVDQYGPTVTLKIIAGYLYEQHENIAAAATLRAADTTKPNKET